MSWSRRAALVVLSGVGLLGVGDVVATTPPTDPELTVPTSTLATTATAPTDGEAPAVPAAPTVTGPTLPRAGSATGGSVHDDGTDDWDVLQLAITAALGLAALALAGHLYGRMQSTTPSVGRTIAPDLSPPT